jgi:hypothetical protein
MLGPSPKGVLAMSDERRPQPVRFRSYSPRIDVHEEAQLIDERGETHDVVLADISRDGFRIMCHRPIGPGQATLILERHGEMSVEVRWSRGKEAGGVFLEEGPAIP